MASFSKSVASSNATNKKPASSNPVASFFQSRKEKRKQNLEKAAMELSNLRAENEENIRKKIEKIDFDKCGLPDDVLNQRKYSKNCCDLEYSANAIIEKISNAPEITQDITESVDKYLINFADQFYNSVVNGNVKGAYTSSNALISCIKIRHTIPYLEDRVVKNFIEQAESYVKQWDLLISMSIEADAKKISYKNLELNYQKQKDEIEKNNKEFWDNITNDDMSADAILQILERRGNDDMTDDQKAIRLRLTELYFDNYNLTISEKMRDSEKNSLDSLNGQISILETKIMKVPVPKDPARMEKFNEQMQDIIKELSMLDTEMDDILKGMEEIEGSLKLLEKAPGQEHIKMVQMKQAQKMLEQKSREQDKNLNAANNSKKKLFERFNIKTEAEMEQMLEEARNNNIESDELTEDAVEFE